MKERLIVIGGVAAGMSAASKYRRLMPDADIDVFEKGRHVSYSACGIPYYLMGKPDRPEDLMVYDAGFFRTKRNINVHLQHAAEEIFPAKRKIRVRDIQNGEITEYPYTKLIIATGASPALPSIAGIELEGIFTLRDLNDGEIIAHYVENHNPVKALIIGAGYIGMEMAEVFSELGMKVSMLEIKPDILEDFHPDLRERVLKTLNDRGVELITSVSVERFLGGAGTVSSAVLSENHSIEADIVLLATGIKPETEVVKRCGIETAKNGAVKVTPKLQTNIPGIYAAGDCAEHYHRVLRKPVYVPLGTTANKQGKIAGANAAGKDEIFQGITGTSVFKIFDLTVAQTGVGKPAALGNGYPYAESVAIKQASKAFYFPGADKLSIAITGDRSTGKLLGVQMVGKDNVAKRIDTAAVALFNEMNVADLHDMDLSYAPPFAPAWEGIQIAAEIWRKNFS